MTLTEHRFWLTFSKLMFAGIAITVRNSFLLGILEMLENIVINGSFNTKLFKRKDYLQETLYYTSACLAFA